MEEATLPRILTMISTNARGVSTPATPCSTHNSFEQRAQAQMEDEMLSHGAERFLHTIKNNKEKHRETSSAAGLYALRDSIQPVSNLIEGFLIQAESTTGPKHCAYRILKEVGAEQAALLIAKTILDYLSSRMTAVKMCMRIAGMLLDELRYRKFNTHHSDCIKGQPCTQGCAVPLFNWKLRNFDTSSYEHMKRSMDASMAGLNIDVKEYQLLDSHKIILGAKCLDIFVRSTHMAHVLEDGTTCGQCANHGYVQIRRSQMGLHNKETRVCATQDTLDWVKRIEADLMFLAPTFRPMIIPPKPWTNSFDGGYWFSLQGEFALLRTDGRHKLDDLDSIHMPVVYGALNAIQETTWGVNEDVLAVVDILRTRPELPPNNVLPSSYEEEEPTRPSVMGRRTREEEKLYKQDVVAHWPEAQRLEYEAVIFKWRRAAGLMHERNHKRKIKNLMMTHIIATAKTMLEITDNNGHPLPFYFPHNLDFRGRAYAIPLYLQPQGDDLQKGLLQFGTGKRLGGDDAVSWLAIHGANCLALAPGGQKLDKLPLSERVRWVHEHSSIIREVAEDPLSNSWWTKADSPFCFLAFCFEWAGYLQHGLDHVSYLPIAMDGSCNGLQHYSALLRDEVGGRAVNLVPSEVPQDIYRTVAQHVVTSLEIIAGQFGETPSAQDPERRAFALDWLKWGKIDRKFVKRQVMTLPYGSKEYGFRGQIKEYIFSLPQEDQPEFTQESRDGFAHIIFLSSVIWESLRNTATAATAGMGWLQQLARLSVREKLPICWTAPNGLPVVQGYQIQTSKRVKTTLVDIKFCPQYPTLSNILDNGKQVSGIAPNIIHSLDASAMMLTVVAAHAQGIDHFAMIHDSYGTHAADAPALARITREEFVRMYTENDVLGMIEEGLMANVDVSKVEKYPERPPLGTLDLEAVKSSDYFFA